MEKKNLHTNDYIWILGGGRMQYYNLLEAKKLGYKTLITDSNKNCYCKSKADLFYNVDIFDTKNNLKLLSKLKKKKLK